MTTPLEQYCQTRFPTPPPALLALDLDGTLLLKNDVVPLDASEALMDAHEAGVAIVVTTGRRYRVAVPPILALPCPAILLSHNGALLKDTRTHATIYRQDFPPEHLQIVWRIIREKRLEPVAHVDGYNDPPEIYTVEATPGTFHAKMLKERYKGISAILAEGTIPECPVIQLLAFGSEEELWQTKATIHARIGDAVYAHAMQVPHAKPFVLEVLHPEGGKWSGVQRIAAALGVPIERIVAVGDDANDLPMLRGAGFGIAMGNGTEAAIAAARFQVAAIDRGGIAEAVREYVYPLL